MSEETYSPKVGDREAAIERLMNLYRVAESRDMAALDHAGWVGSVIPGVDEERLQRHCAATVDAVMALARSVVEVEVKAEALREAADAQDADPEFRDPLRLKSDWLRERADEMEGKS